MSSSFVKTKVFLKWIISSSNQFYVRTSFKWFLTFCTYKIVADINLFLPPFSSENKNVELFKKLFFRLSVSSPHYFRFTLANRRNRARLKSAIKDDKTTRKRKEEEDKNLHFFFHLSCNGSRGRITITYVYITNIDCIEARQENNS